MPGILGLYDTATNVNNLDETTRSEVFNEVIDQINHEFPTTVLQGPSETDRQRIRERVEAQISAALRKRNCRPGVQQEGAIAEELTRRILGLGFLDLLLPPARTDISEITIYSSGLLQIMLKGSVRWESIDLHPGAGEIWRVLDRLIGPQNKTLNETNPSINAKAAGNAAQSGWWAHQSPPPGNCSSRSQPIYQYSPV